MGLAQTYIEEVRLDALGHNYLSTRKIAIMFHQLQCSMDDMTVAAYPLVRIRYLAKQVILGRGYGCKSCHATVALLKRFGPHSNT